MRPRAGSPRSTNRLNINNARGEILVQSVRLSKSLAFEAFLASKDRIMFGRATLVRAFMRR